MNDLSALPLTQPLTRSDARVALLIDGDNLSHAHAGALITASAQHGALIIKRVYGNMSHLPGWNAAPGLKAVHAGTGKNATDLLLAVEAMGIMLTNQADVLILATSDGDFSHLAQTLTERGHPVIGIGEAKAPANFRKSCARFHDITTGRTGDPVIALICGLLVEHRALKVTDLNSEMKQTHGFHVGASSHKTWKKLLAAHAELFVCETKDNQTWVRLKP